VEKDRLDPWGETFIGNYERLHKEFGIERIDSVLPRFKRPSLHLRRGIDFGHRDLGRVLDAVDNDKPFVIRFGWTNGGGHIMDGMGYEIWNGYDYVSYMNPWPGEGNSEDLFSWMVSASDHRWTHTLRVR